MSPRSDVPLSSDSESGGTDIAHHSPSASGASPIQIDGSSEIHKTPPTRVLCCRKESMDALGQGHNSPRVTIGAFSDDVLLEIFDFCLANIDLWEYRGDGWCKLAHVCRRWRDVVFASPRRLDLHLLCTEKTPVRKALDVWPPLPIEILLFSVESEAEDNVIAALEHPDRIRVISLRGVKTVLKRLITVMQEPFPVLESLHLVKEDKKTGETVPVLPNTFMGGSAPRLRALHFDCIPFPALPRLLSSLNDLVNLQLYRIPHSGYISPEAVATSISALPRLTYFSIGFESPASRPDPTKRRAPPLIRATLPALTNIWFYGVTEYLEDLLARVDAPLLYDLKITVFNQLIFDVQQLLQFIGRIPIFSSYNIAELFLSDDDIKLLTFKRPHNRFPKIFEFHISCRGIDWQVSSMEQICNQLSSLFSGIEKLKINGLGRSESTWYVDLVNAQWLELLPPFAAVQTLQISCVMPAFVSALQGVGGEFITEPLLPALEDIFLDEKQEDIEPFIIARQGSAHPVTVYPLGTEKK